MLTKRAKAMGYKIITYTRTDDKGNRFPGRTHTA